MGRNQTDKAELLAPAGNFEKLEMAIHYGADAVYLGGRQFSLRSLAGNFSVSELLPAVQLAHRNNVAVYLACNIFPRNSDLPKITDYLQSIGPIGIDALIVSDPGVVMVARDTVPHIPLHLSTQANTTNINSIKFWEKQGIKRINTARELQLKEIEEISRHSNIEIEAFVHGAMCMAYSGRCLLSSYMAGRNSNRGDCAHSCRWQYGIVEALRPDQYMPLEEDSRGSYILSAKDLCMVDHVGEMINAGIRALKIEGRMKGINYLSTTVKVYREAIDAYYENADIENLKDRWHQALAQVNSRGFCTGFYFGDKALLRPGTLNSQSVPQNRLVGKIIRRLEPGKYLVDIRNKIAKGDTVEVLSPAGPDKHAIIEGISDEDGWDMPVAQSDGFAVLLIEDECRPNDLIRKLAI